MKTEVIVIANQKGGVGKTITWCQLGDWFGTGRKDGILLIMVDIRTNIAKDMSTLLRNTYGSKFSTEIPHSVWAKESSIEGKSIYAYFYTGNTQQIQGSGQKHCYGAEQTEGARAMKKVNIKKLLLSNIPYVVVALLATNFGEAWRIAQGANASEKIKKKSSDSGT